MDKKALINELIEIIKPIVLKLDYKFYYLEFVQEEGENYLRVYIDNEEGITLTDCEKVSRKISEALDETDPIDVGYFLEVSSPGIFKQLFTDEHLQDNINKKVNIDLNKIYREKDKFDGKLIAFNKDEIVVNYKGRELDIPRNLIDKITLEGKL